MPAMPTSVYIGPMNYVIEECDSLTSKRSDGTLSELYGRYRMGEALISLDKNLSDEYKPVVLMHELIHALLTHAGKEEQNEETIDLLAFGIIDLLQRNYALADYLMGRERAVAR